MESSSISFSEPKYAIKMYDLPIFKGLGAKFGLGKEIRAPRQVGKKIRVPATLYTRGSSSQLSAGYLWDTFEIQGTNRTWYAGSSVSFESVRSVMAYNKLLLRQFDQKHMVDPVSIPTNVKMEL